jgi:hypothetical protein
METLRSKVIRLAANHSSLRPHLLPLLKSAASFDEAEEVRELLWTIFDNASTRDQEDLGTYSREDVRGWVDLLKEQGENVQTLTQIFDDRWSFFGEVDSIVARRFLERLEIISQNALQAIGE